MNLFAEVKDYIRENDVKEIDVAEHFGIPVSKVRRWIKEGRIQYKEGENITPIHCQILVLYVLNVEGKMVFTYMQKNLIVMMIYKVQ